jgi:hypothetical protein
MFCHELSGGWLNRELGPCLAQSIAQPLARATQLDEDRALTLGSWAFGLRFGRPQGAPLFPPAISAQVESALTGESQ